MEGKQILGVVLLVVCVVIFVVAHRAKKRYLKNGNKGE